MCVSYRADHSRAGGSLRPATAVDAGSPSLHRAVPPSPAGAWAPAGPVRPGRARGARRGAGRVAGPARPRASPAPGRSWRGRSRAALGSAPRALGFTFRCAGRARPPPGARRLLAKVLAAAATSQKCTCSSQVPLSPLGSRTPSQNEEIGLQAPTTQDCAVTPIPP